MHTKYIIEKENNYRTKKKYQISIRRFYISDSPSKEISKYLSIDKGGFKNYLDAQILPDMLSENFGVIWGIDHIIPVEVFDLNNEEDLKLCYHYLNMFPMFNEDNRLKGCSVHFSIQKLQNKIKKETDPGNIEILTKLISKCEYEIENRYNKYL
jgi:hypothetical protein